MLVLSRRTNESIVLPDLGVTVQVLQIKSNQVKIGIDAPDSVRILREELRDADLSQGIGRRCKSLIVDDDTNERELMAGLLEMNGCECITAGDGQEALDYLASHEQPDFVLMDFRMPRCDGREAIQAIRRNPRFQDLKVFMVSGATPQDAGIDRAEAGFDAWFQKPLNPTKLWAAIQRKLAVPS